MIRVDGYVVARSGFVSNHMGPQSFLSGCIMVKGEVRYLWFDRKRCERRL